MVVIRVPTVSFVELKCLRMSRVAEALIVEAMGLEKGQKALPRRICDLREQSH